MPGASYSVRLKTNKITRLPSPYVSKCINAYPEKLASGNTANTTYSSQNCFSVCFNLLGPIKRCNCTQEALVEGMILYQNGQLFSYNILCLLPMAGIIMSTEANISVPFCSTIPPNTTQSKCIEKLTKLGIQNKSNDMTRDVRIKCKTYCQLECEKTNYEV